MNPAYFIADTHFGYYEYLKEKPLIEKFENLCKEIELNSGELYILGDLFDYWFEYKSVIQKYSYRIIAALEHLAEKGHRITYIIGNHDFAHKDLFEKQLGITVSSGMIEKTIYNKKFFLAHGDGLVENDRGYLILKSIVRNKKLQALYSKLHPNIGIGLARYFSKKSRHYTNGRDYGEQDDLLQFAKKKISDGIDYVILGHSHRFVFEKIGNGFYINLGSWLIKPTYGKFDGKNFEIIECNNGNK